MTNSPQPSDPTVGYYNDRAQEFIERTRSIDMSALYEPFLHHMPAGGRILDAGCGSGRDTAAFAARGFDVTAFDASEAQVKAASAFTGRPVLHLAFDQLSFPASFDGIWASASLLHIPTDGIDAIIQRLTAALRPGGVIYMSFKKGAAEEWRGRRFFSDYDDAKAKALLERHPELQQLDMWTTPDAARPQQEWLNILARRW